MSEAKSLRATKRRSPAPLQRELGPCPFCGRRGVFGISHPDDPAKFFVVCPNIECKFHLGTVASVTRGEALASWNKRDRDRNTARVR